MDLDLNGRSVLVTGGSGGIGSIVAEQFAREGADVTISARGRERLEQTRSEIASRAGVDIRATEMDVTDAESVTSAVQSVLDATGRIDAVISSAVDVVGALPGTPSELDVTSLGNAIDVKVLGILRLAQAVVPHMKASGYGRIIGVGGASSRQIGSASASVRNSALAALCKNMATELGPHGITVNVIHPGAVLTERNRPRVEAEMERNGGTFEEAEARMATAIPVGRMIHPEDIGALAMLLASSAGGAITGQTIAVDGGSTTAITY